MRIISFNANGLRSAATKGFFDWFAAQDADILCVQETKAQEHQLSGPEFQPAGYRVRFRDASTKMGYSGVAIYSKREPDEVRTALGWPEFDEEGRYIEARFGNLSVVSFYIPSGSSGELRQGYKFQVMAWLAPILEEWRTSGRDYVLCGDWNIVRSRAGHQELEIQPEEFRLPARRARLVQPDVHAKTAAGWTPTARCIPKARTTPGGATAAPRAPTTWAGASTTRSSRLRCVNA